MKICRCHRQAGDSEGLGGGSLVGLLFFGPWLPAGPLWGVAERLLISFSGHLTQSVGVCPEFLPAVFSFQLLGLVD